MTLIDLSKSECANALMKSSLDSKLIIITSLDGGSGDFTRKVNSIEGVGSARLHLRPTFAFA